MTTRSLLFDISEYQGYDGMPGRKWDRLVKKGAIGVIIRSSIGGKADRAWQQNLASARARKLIIAGYHYLQPGDIEGQADLFVSLLEQGASGTTARILPGWLDVEQAGLTRRDVIRFVRRFRQGAPKGAFLGIYSSAAKWRWLTGNLDAGELFDGQWSAYYLDRAWVVADVMPTPASRWGGLKVDLWQFGKLFIGASGSPNRSFVDGNVFDGDELALLDLYGIKVPKPMDQRPARRAAYNAQLAAYVAALEAEAPITGSGPAWKDGVTDARADILAAIDELVLTDPAA